MVDSAVAPFQRELAIERLRVGDDCLGLDSDPPGREPGDRVPGAKVARIRKRYLGVPSKTGMQLATEPLKQAGVTRIPDRVSCRERTNAELQSDRRRDRTEILESEVCRLAAFEAPDPGRVDVRRLTDVAEAQPRPNSSSSNVARKSEPRLARAATAPIAGPLPRCHARK